MKPSHPAVTLTDPPRALRFGTFCSGIGAPEAAWVPLGWQPQFFSEIDPFASAVLAHHYPGVPNLGDMTAIDPGSIPDADVWVAGTPCQSFSVAGLRGSLSDARGNLALHFTKLIHARNPGIVVWENVPGVLSTRDNAFGCFLAGLVGEDDELRLPAYFGSKWPDAGVATGPRRTAAWRILDAQFFGVPQRRRRVFVVSVRGSGNWRCAEALFPVLESVRGHTPPSREAGARIAGCFAARTGAGGGFGTDFESDGGLVAAFDWQSGGDSRGLDPKETAQLQRSQVPALVTPIPIDMRQASRGERMTNNRSNGACPGGAPGTGIGEAGDPSPSLSVSHTPAIAFDTTQITSDKNFSSPKPGDPCHPLASQTHPPAIAYTIHGTDKTASVASETDVAGSLRTKPPGSIENSSTTVCISPKGNDNVHSQMQQVRSDNAADPSESSEDRGGTRESDSVPSLHPFTFQTRIGRNGRGQPKETVDALTSCEGGTHADSKPHVVTPTMAVRRLTPTECEKLQGFPPGFTLITYRGKPAADGPRYRAIGNSMCVDVVRWIGERIQAVEEAGKAVKG